MTDPTRKMVLHTGGCHCGRVRYEVRAPAHVVVSECNCSICTKSGFLALIVPRERFTLLQGAEHVKTYTFHTGRAEHTFCGVCGIKSFYYPRSHRDGVSVNVRCLDAGTVEQMMVEHVDGQNWEAHFSDDEPAPYRN